MAMQKAPTSSGSTSQTVNLDDAPKMPTLRLVLRPPQQNLGKSGQISVQLLSEKEREKLMSKLDKRGYLTQKEMDILNKDMRMSLRQDFNQFGEQILDLLKISPDDEPHVIVQKSLMCDEIVKGLGSLFDWMGAKLDEIFKIKDDKLRRESLDKLFDKLEDILKACHEAEAHLDAQIPTEIPEEPDNPGKSEGENQGQFQMPTRPKESEMGQGSQL